MKDTPLTLMEGGEDPMKISSRFNYKCSNNTTTVQDISKHSSFP